MPPRARKPGFDIDSLKKIRLLICDVDGVLTDGSIALSANGNEAKTFHVRDGAGIAYLRQQGIKAAIITGRKSALVSYRAEELKIDDVFQGNLNKLEAYNILKKKYSLKDAEIAVVGDDLADMPILREAGVSFTVADAVPEVKETADYVTEKAGGRGAVREIAEAILTAQGKWQKVLERFS